MYKIVYCFKEELNKDKKKVTVINVFQYHESLEEQFNVYFNENGWNQQKRLLKSEKAVDFYMNLVERTLDNKLSYMNDRHHMLFRAHGLNLDELLEKVPRYKEYAYMMKYWRRDITGPAALKFYGETNFSFFYSMVNVLMSEETTDEIIAKMRMPGKGLNEAFKLQILRVRNFPLDLV